MCIALEYLDDGMAGGEMRGLLCCGNIRRNNGVYLLISFAFSTASRFPSKALSTIIILARGEMRRLLLRSPHSRRKDESANRPYNFLISSSLSTASRSPSKAVSTILVLGFHTSSLLGPIRYFISLSL